MKKTLLTILLAILFSHTFSQSPGYCGRKFSVNYGFYFINALSNPNYSGNNGLLSFNTTHCIAPEYVVGRRIALGISLKYSRSGFLYKQNIPYTAFNKLTSTNHMYTLDGTEVSGRDQLCGTMEILSAGFYPKIFFGNNIAPLGAWFKPELLMSFAYVQGAPKSKIQEHINEQYSNYYTNGTDQNYPVPDIKNYSPYLNMGLGLEFGESRIYFNRIIIEYGMRIGLTFGSFMSRTNSYNESNYYKLMSGGRIFHSSLINFKLGAGLLAF